MNWNRTGPDTMEAVGARGTYTITRFSRVATLLSGLGHDGMPMLSLPYPGKRFHDLFEAQDLADTLDSAHAEPQASGA